MKIKTLLLGLVVVFALGACSEDEDDNGGSGSVNCFTVLQDLSTYAQAIQATQEAYQTDDTAANCIAWVESIEDYIDAVEAAVAGCDDPTISAALAAYTSNLAIFKTELTEAKSECGS